MSMQHQSSEGNPLEYEARADELEAEASLLRAKAKRLRIEQERIAPATHSQGPRDLTRREYAALANVSEATVSRWVAAGMPSIPVGTTVRIEPNAADEWRRRRGRKPTTPKAKAPDVDVDVDLSRAGLRVIGGGQ